MLLLSISIHVMTYLSGRSSILTSIMLTTGFSNGHDMMQKIPRLLFLELITYKLVLSASLYLQTFIERNTIYNYFFNRIENRDMVAQFYFRH